MGDLIMLVDYGGKRKVMAKTVSLHSMARAMVMGDDQPTHS